MSIRFVSVLLARCVLGVAVLSAQDLPGKNLDVTVRVRAVTMSKDTVTVSYSLLNSGGSAEALADFTVKALVVPLQVISPSSDWAAGKVFGRLSVATWTSLQGIAHGDSTPTLTFRAIGLPGIVTAWYAGDSIITVPADDSTSIVPNYNPLLDLSKQIQTVGVDAAPTSLSALLSRLHTLTDSSCTLTWITNSGLCTILGADLGASPSHVLAFATSLDSAHAHGADVGNAAYGLLKPNAEYIKAFVDTSIVQLHVVCAGIWLVRNYNYAAFAGTWTTTGEVHSGSVTVDGRANDAHEFTDLRITSAGTNLNLYYNGVLLRTRERGTSSCP